MLDADRLLKEQGQMETDRSAFDAERAEVAALLLPRERDLLGSTAQGGNQMSNNTARIFDETARQALDHGCAVFEGEVIPQGVQWQKLRARDADLMKNRRVALWMEALGDRLFALRNSPYSGFAIQTHQSVKSLLAFGDQGMWTDKLLDARRRPVGLAYRSDHVGQIYVKRDPQGYVRRVHRKFELSHEDAVAKWGEAAPECARKGMRDKRPNDKSTYLHVLMPNPAYDPARIDAAGKKVASCYVSEADKQVFDAGGYRTMRMTVSSYDRVQTQDYGSGPFMDVLPAIRVSQEVVRDVMTAIEYMANPALGTVDDMLDQVLMYSPGGITYGAVGPRGERWIQRLWDDPDIGPALQFLGDTRAVIKRAGFEDLYLVRQEVKSHVSATERMQRDQQRGTLLAPLLRQETEWFTQMLDVELDLMAEMGMLDDMPPELAEAGGLFETIYDNPLEQARSAGEGAGFYAMVDGMTPIMQLNPEAAVAEFFKVYPVATLLPKLAKIHGVPVSWSASAEDQAASDEQARALAEKDQLIDVGIHASTIAKNLAAAGAAGGLGLG